MSSSSSSSSLQPRQDENDDGISVLVAALTGNADGGNDGRIFVTVIVGVIGDVDGDGDIIVVVRSSSSSSGCNTPQPYFDTLIIISSIDGLFPRVWFTSTNLGGISYLSRGWIAMTFCHNK